MTSKRASDPLERVRELREAFLTPHACGLPDYWDAPETLAAYDSTLARRIAWKWDAVVGAIEERPGLSFQPFARVVDWGCGTGVASRSLITRALATDSARTRSRLPGKETHFSIFDRSARAMAFAEGALRAEGASDVAQCRSDPQVDEGTLLLVSHVLTELDARAREDVFGRAERAGGVLWVEPGTPFCSAHLVELRERLRSLGFVALLPCPHSSTCGLAGGAGSDWCHVYAEPPREVFQDATWARTARALGIDLRSLPVSFLFVVRHERVDGDGHSPMGEGLVLGRPKVLKGRTLAVACRPGAVETLTVPHRSQKEFARALEKPDFLQAIALSDKAGDRVDGE